MPGLALKPATTASASAQPGTRRGLTNEQTWMCFRPVSASASISLILSAVLIGPGLDLEAFARSFLVDVDVGRQVGHWMFLFGRSGSVILR